MASEHMRYSCGEDEGADMRIRGEMGRFLIFIDVSLVLQEKSLA